jgi:predicted nuclease of restriction endonuclease-like (RecB) superfamily
MLKLYWFIGSEIVKKQKNSNWGDGILKQISADLQKEFSDMKGFSETNVKYMRNWYLFFEKCPQVVDDLQNANIF